MEALQNSKDRKRHVDLASKFSAEGECYSTQSVFYFERNLFNYIP